MAAPAQVLTVVRADQFLDAQVARNPAQAALDATLRQMLGAARNPLSPPICPLPLMHSVNACLAVGLQPPFTAAMGWDAGAFLSHLLDELVFLPGYLVNHLEVGVCQVCGAQHQQVATHNWLV